MKKFLPLIAAVASATIFGFAMLFIKSGMAVVGQDTVKFLAFRFSIGFLVMSLLVLLRIRKVHYRGKPYPLLLLCGLFNPLISQVCETTSTSHAPTAQIAIGSSLIPIVMVLLSIPLNREYPTRRQMFFMVVAVAGVIITNLGGQMAGVTALGLILIAATVLAVSINRVLVRRATHDFTSFEIIYATTGMGALGFSLFTICQHGMEGRLDELFIGFQSMDFIIAVLYMGIGSCVVGFLCMTYASANLPIAVSSTVSMLNTPITIAVGALILHEQVRPVDAIGAVVILAGLIGMSLSYDRNRSNKLVLQGDEEATPAKIPSR